MNLVSGKIKLGREVLADLEGHWDGSIYITDRLTGTKELFWFPDGEVIRSRMQRSEVPMEKQEDFESVKMWQKVTKAIEMGVQTAATEEKTVLENAQRKRAKQLRDLNDIHEPIYFEYEPASAMWLYKHSDYRPWDLKTDLAQTEGNFVIYTRSRLRTPLVRSSSLSSKLRAPGPDVDPIVTNLSSEEDEAEPWPRGSQSTSGRLRRGHSVDVPFRKQDLENLLRPIGENIQDVNRRISTIQYQLEREGGGGSPFLRINSLGQTLTVLAIFLAAQAILISFFLRRL
jgi:hypothetical protein